jgi:uncharacterized protein YbjT (DUF2867 family)
MKVAVLGASGKTGSQVVAQLTEKGHELIKIGHSQWGFHC